MIYILTGYTASGKTTYENMLLKELKDFNKIVSYTTRPIREEEEDGRDYFFVSKEVFKDLEESDVFAAPRTYHTIEDGKSSEWSYGINKFNIDLKKDYLLVLDANGTLDLIKAFGKKFVKIIYLFCDDIELYNRAAFRGDEQEEFIRRLKSDKEQFSKLKNQINLEVNTSGQYKEKNMRAIKAFIEQGGRLYGISNKLMG